MFTDSDSFYYSETFDLTTSLQRQHSEGYQSNKHLPLWQQVDPRFFWNRHMLDELIQADRDPEASTMCRHDYFSLVPTKKMHILKENLKWPCSNHCTSISHPKELDLLLIFPKNNRNCIQIFFYKLPHKGCAFYNISWTCMYLYFKTKILDPLHESCWYNVLVLILVF